MALLDMAKVNEKIDKWITKWEKGCFSSQDIRKEWESWIPDIANQVRAITNCVDSVLENGQFVENFITILEKFVFYGYSTDRIDEICKREEYTTCDNTSTINDTLYYFKCNECEEKGVNRMLCAECFANSEHREHKYIMFSTPSGYCCCGESGTWAKAWFCSKHSDLSRYSLPEAVENRAGILIEAIVSYIDDLLNFYQEIDQRRFINPTDDNAFNVTLYCKNNYENISGYFDNLILEASGKYLLEFYQKMHQDGYVTVKVTKTHFEAIMACCNEENSNVKAVVFLTNDIIHQNFQLKMLAYLRKFLKYGSGFRRIFSKSMMNSVSPLNQISRTENFLELSEMLPERFRIIVNDLLVFGMMKEYETKESLVKMIAERYDVIMKMDHGKICKMTFWPLITIPKLSHRLIANENIISVILKAFLNDFKKENEEYDLVEDQPFIIHLDTVQILLRTVPITWTKNLRMGLLNGLTCFLQVIDAFQNIDSETREIENHVEYERNVGSINEVASRLAHCASLFLKWCKSDNEILRIAFEKTIKMINQRICFEPDETKKTVNVLTHSTECLPYDSEIHPVSVHLPLFRFLVSLCGAQLGHCDETLLDLLKTTVTSKIFDSVLKIQAMLAQVTAGMWIRNGNSAAIRSFLYRYTNTAEIFDRDIQLLQMVASVTESNKFLIEILEKYCLIEWINPNFEKEVLENLDEEETNQIVAISEEFLRLLITVLIERPVPDVSDADIVDDLQYNIIHALCIQPCPRSQLEDFVENANTTEAVINSAIEKLAVLKISTSESENGNYELRQKDSDRYNPLYYHYNPTQMTEANEYQSQQRKAADKPDCFPPSELPKLKQFFVPMVNIFQCDVMLHIIRTVLERFLDLESKSSSETQLQYILYLIGYALREEQSGRYSTLSFTKKTANWNLLSCLEKLSRSTRNDLPKELLLWTIEKYKEVAQTNPSNEATIIVTEEAKTEKRSQLVLAKRAKILQEMQEMQNKFLTDSSGAYEEEETEDFDLNTEDSSRKTQETCILCQETQNVRLANSVMVMAGYVQYSNVLCGQRKNVNSDFQNTLLTLNIGSAFYTSSCGHAMHAKCLKSYLRTHSRNEFEDDDSSGFSAFLCPLCKSLSNTALPLLPHMSPFQNNPIYLNKNFSKAIFDFAGKYFKAKKSPKNPLHVWKSLSYTVHVIEMLLRHSNKPILGYLPSNHRNCLDFFIRIAAVVSNIYPNDGSYTAKIKELLKGNPRKRNMLLSYDLFGFLVTVIFSQTSVFDTEEIYKTIHLVFVAQIVQILILTNFEKMIDDVKSKDVTPFKDILQLFGENQSLNHLSETFIWTYVQKTCLPFLRRCVLLFSFVTDVPPPVELTEAGEDTFANMCSYLKFPQTREKVFDMIRVYPYVKSWFHHPQVTNYLKNRGQTFKTFDPCHIKQLIKLPREYFEIVRKAVSLKCPNTNDQEVFNPYLCLVCGEMICTRFCCDKIVNGVHYQSSVLHLRKCRGVFLKVITSEIVFRLALPEIHKEYCVPGPYLDEYHEGDVDFNRGFPLYLSSEKYNQLHTLWLSHGIWDKYSRLFMEEFDSDDDSSDDL